ncbi:MAG: YihY family inner membrane protein [Nitrospinota bacterium]
MLESAIYKKIVSLNKPSKNWGGLLQNYLASILKLLIETLDKFIKDDCLMYAASLAYTTLIALAPLSAVTLSVVSSFELSKEATLSFVLNYWLPNKEMALIIESNLDIFANNAASVSAFGLFFLAIFVIWGLNTIEWSFNMIWKVSKFRSLLNKFFAFWSAITFVPVFLAAALIASTKLGILIESNEWADYSYLQGFLLKLLPYILIWSAFLVIYRIIPNTYVEFKPAIVGAITAGTLFEQAKNIFNYYIANYTTYEAIYGALSVIPIFLFWLYLSWLIVLFGAVLTYSIQNSSKIGTVSLKSLNGSKYKTYYLIRILLALVKALRSGSGSVSFTSLLQQFNINEHLLLGLTKELKLKGYLEFVNSPDRQILLAKHPKNIFVSSMLFDLNFDNFAIPDTPKDEEQELITNLYKRSKVGVKNMTHNITLDNFIDDFDSK